MRGLSSLGSSTNRDSRVCSFHGYLSRFRSPGMSLLLAFAETAKILSDGILISGRHGERFAASHLIFRLAVSIATQLQFKPVYVVQHLSMKLLDKLRITRKAPGIEALHLANQFLNFFQRRGIVLRQLMDLIQLIQPVSIDAL